MLLEVFIIEKGTSFLLVQRAFTKKKISMDATIFSGLVSAIAIFTQELKIGEIQHFQTGENRVIISHYHDINVVGIIEEKKEDEFVEISIKRISEEFWDKYSQVLDNWNNNTDLFQEFIPRIDEIVYTEFSKFYIALDFPQNVIKVVRKFQNAFEPEVLTYIGFKTGTARALLYENRKNTKKLLRKELSLFSLNSIKENKNEGLIIEIPMCPICRGIKNINFTCNFISGFIEGFLSEILDKKEVHVEESKCIARQDSVCQYEVEMDGDDLIKVNNRDFEWFEGMTVENMLELNNYSFPEIIVKINDTYVPKEEYSRTLINKGDNVLALHMFGGG